MYMKPTFPAGGVLWFRYASIQSPALLSQHIGSGPGVAGLSGMQVKALVPLRRGCIPPFGSGATTVAFSPTFWGAALSALAIISAALGAAPPAAAAPRGMGGVAARGTS